MSGLEFLTDDPQKLNEELRFLGCELHDEMRRSPQIRELLLSWLDASTKTAVRHLNARLINEREADMLRGKIGELQKLRDVIQNGDSR